MCPFLRCYARLPADLRCALKCLGIAVVLLTVLLTPLAPTEPEPDCLPASLDLTHCAFSDDLAQELLARVLAAEVGEKSYAAQTALGAVLVNRLSDPRFPGDLGAVIRSAGLRAAAGEIPMRSLRAARAALMGVDPTHGALRWGERETLETVSAEFDGLAFGR